MSAAEAGANAKPATPGRPLTRASAVRLARTYVRAYNDRDLHAMLTLQDENVVSHPSPLFRHRRLVGHAGVREWWAAMVASGRWYHVVITDIRKLDPDRIAILGQIHERGEVLSPWGVIVRVRDGLIVESRSYLSDKDLLDELGLIG